MTTNRQDADLSADVLVLGSGIVGVSTAYFLAKHGKSVVVVDQLPGPALDTSFANGGQVSVCHAEPWASPEAPLKVLKWLMREDSPLLFRPRLDPMQWWWLVSWLAECRPARFKQNTLDILKLATLSRTKIQDIRRDESLIYDHKTLGILHFFRSKKAFDGAMPMVELMAKFGCERQIVDTKRILEIEPALAGAANEIVGGTYTAEDESGDAYQFTVALTEACERMGVRFLYNHQVVKLEASGGRVTGVDIRNLTDASYRTLKAGHYVMAMGSFSLGLLSPLGIRPNIYPAKGYSVTIPIDGHNGAPTVSLTDDAYKIVYTRLGDRLRVAGTAELSGYSRDINRVRAEALLNRTREVFPSAGNFEAATFWTGLRPTTPSNMPYLGRSSLTNLSLNTGHGTLGWTMGPGSGYLLAEAIVSGDARRRLI